MPEAVRRPLTRARPAATEQPPAGTVRTGERQRPQWEGLFREPEWPAEAEETSDIHVDGEELE